MRVGVIMYETSLTKGQELVAQRMVRELRREGHEAYLITSIFHDQEEVISLEALNLRGGYLHSFDETLNIPVVRVTSRKANWPPRRIMFTDFVSNLTKIVDDLRLDVLITHSTLWNGPEETAKFVEWKRNQARGGAPVRPVVFCHMSHFQEPTDERYDLEERTFRQAWNDVSLPTILRAADLILVTTPYERESMRKVADVADDKFVLFPGGIDSTSLEFGLSSDFRRKYGVPPGANMVAYVGSVEERKNPKALLEVAKMLQERKDIHFVIAGRLEGDYGEEVKSASENLPNVTVTGSLSDVDYMGLLKESWVNINMSKSEALGLAQIEFMYEGVPVITSGVGGQSWVVKDGSTGVVLKGPADISGAANAIAFLAGNPVRRDKLARKAKESAQNLTMTILIRQFIKRVSSLLYSGDDESEGGLEPDEKLVEAWVKRGYKVAVTTKKLLVDSAKGGARVAIPLADIISFKHHRRVSWKALALGVAASLALYLVGFFDTPAWASLSAWLVSLSSLAPDIALSIVWTSTLLPLGIALVFLLLTATEGYQIVYGVRRRLFLPMDFVKALQMADELTPQSLFQPDQMP